MPPIGNTCACCPPSATCAWLALSSRVFGPGALVFVLSDEQKTPMLISLVVGCLRAVMFLLLASSSRPPPGRCSAGRTDALHPAGQAAYGSIFSPLLKALSEHGGSGWNPASRKKVKPEQKYIKYLTDVYKRTSRAHRTLEAGLRYNVVRLIKPQDQCLAKRHKESFKLDLSYSLDQVREKEQLMRATLLYNSAHVNSVCYLSIKEQEHSNKCPLCAGIHRAVNFTSGADDPVRGSWLEVDITMLLRPFSKLPKQNIQLLINVVCPEEQQAVDAGHKGPLEFTAGPPPLLLYLQDDSKASRQALPSTAAETLGKQMIFKATQRARAKRRRKRESAKSKRGDKSLDIHLPELLPSSEFSTSYCDLYDFRLRFSQLKLDHWIVFPPKYNPRYCRGICPRTIGFIYGSPVHTMVQNIIYEKLDSSVPRPSCIPSHYSPLSVMIFEEDGSYAYKEFEDMIATRCTCR
ncbi:growth/differentiation factor 9 isoform X2 [Nerophis ophidion]|uniref:growth/differentiation factor 9 isoform X2 n=1 Tax=Nerophis ophidion TaxID=159077 RepID=UPI002ADF2336|nr:growth/differentiation factor 9 isoform X2 [Nerophis ophidion]